MYIGDLFTKCFDPKLPSSCITYIKINWKIYCVVSGLYINEISFLQLIGLHLMVTEVCIDVVSYCRFCGKLMSAYSILLIFF